ncbi:peptidase C13 family protein [Ostertagia ostertagi]
MMYDDVAYDPKNPKPGELHNSPDGPDYRKGMKVDYRTTSVNKIVFQAVLSGDSVVAGKYPGTQKKTTSSSSYTDHGAYNVLGMPSGSPMMRSDLASYIQHARSAGKFHKLSIYIEACESGSMLMGMEHDNFGIKDKTP